jgi:hypothetical protein
MPYGKCSSRQRPHDAAYSSRAPSVAREQLNPCRPLWPEPKDRAQVARAEGREPIRKPKAPTPRIGQRIFGPERAAI